MIVHHCEKRKDLSTPSKWMGDTKLLALSQYAISERTKHKGDSMKTVTTGLYVKGDIPYLHSQPDSVQLCACCGPRCIRVKYPWSLKYKDLLNTLLSGSWTQVLMSEDDCMDCELVKHASLYYELQGDMLCTGFTSEDAVLVLSTGCSGKIHCINVPFNKSFCVEMAKSLADFFQTHVLRELMQRNQNLSSGIETLDDWAEQKLECQYTENMDEA